MRHNEHELQKACVRWFRLAYPEYAYSLFAVPNGGFRNATEAKRLKAEGVIAGVSDLILLVPRQGKGALCIEMKTLTGVQRESQKIWQSEIEKYGNEYVVVRSFDDFRTAIENYLFEKPAGDTDAERNNLRIILNG